MGTTTERYDVYTRFARTHLSTSGEQVVYLTLVGGQERSWSAEEIALRGHLGEKEAGAVLTRFAQAGVAEAVARVTGPTRYRWRADMDYLGAAFEGFDSIDPVCDMPVMADSPLAESWDGRNFRFCSSLCRAVFVASPKAFAPRSSAQETG